MDAFSKGPLAACLAARRPGLTSISRRLTVLLAHRRGCRVCDGRCENELNSIEPRKTVVRLAIYGGKPAMYSIDTVSA